MSALALALGIALVVAAGACRLVIGLAGRTAFVDRPGSEAHKQHGGSVPYGGGLAVAAGLAVAIPLAIALTGIEPALGAFGDRGPLWPIVGGAGLLMLLGLVDDRRPLPAWLKLTLQVLVVVAAASLGDLRIDILLNADLGAAAVVLAVLWLLLITNAFNLIDHADGLSATVAGIGCVVLLSASLMAHDLTLALVWASLIGALGGFLLWNLPPARIYLGDGGSLPLGFLIGAGSLSATFWPSGSRGTSPLAVLAPALITALPLYDTGVVMVKRWRHQRPLLHGDRNHISHRLGRLGLSPRASLGCAAALQTALAAGALLLRDVDLTGGLIILGQAVAILIAAVLMEARRDPTV